MKYPQTSLIDEAHTSLAVKDGQDLDSLNKFGATFFFKNPSSFKDRKVVFINDNFEKVVLLFKAVELLYGGCNVITFTDSGEIFGEANDWKMEIRHVKRLENDDSLECENLSKRFLEKWQTKIKNLNDAKT